MALVLDRRCRQPRADLVVGGCPTVVLRLSASGAELVARWAAGDVVGAAPGAGVLARRLLDAGVAHPRPVLPGPPPDHGDSPAVTVSVVVPVRDRPLGLAATLSAVDAVAARSTGRTPVVEVIVVDDASADPTSTRRIVDDHPRARLVARSINGGPAAARNTGWRHSNGGVVVFVDADCIPEPGLLTVLLPHLVDPAVAAVAPRIVASGDRSRWWSGWLAAYEAVRSPLDMGPDPAPVRPRSNVAYVPTTTLVVRHQALDALGGFDEALGTGEDVDLVWRLHASGRRVRYEPAVTAAHPVRSGLRAFVAQRSAYGRSAAALAQRHGAALSPLVASASAVAPWLLLVAGRPRMAAAVAAGSTAALVARRRHHVPVATLLRLGLTGHLGAGRALAQALRRPWWPLVVAGAIHPSLRRVAIRSGAVAVAPLLAEWAARRPSLDLGRYVVTAIVDDGAYGFGVGKGAVGARSLAALRPSLPPRRARQVGAVHRSPPARATAQVAVKIRSWASACRRRPGRAATA